MGKVTNFAEATKQLEDQEPLFDKDSILRNLQAIPENIASEYVEGVSGFLEEMLIWKNIVSSAKRPRLSKHLIDGLDEIQLSRLNKIVMGLASRDPIAKINEIVEAAFDLKARSPERDDKAIELVERVRSRNIDYQAHSKELTAFSKRLQLLSSICIVLGLGKEFEHVIIDRLAAVSEDELDKMLQLTS